MNKDLDRPQDDIENSSPLPASEDSCSLDETPKEEKLTEFEKEQQDASTRRIRWRRERKEKREVEKMPLEKGDYLAMVIAAFLTFGPIFLVLILVLLFVGWFFGM